MSRIALVTGANRGLGFETARQLAQAGITVIIGARDARKGDEARRLLRTENGLEVDSVQLDVAEEASVMRAAATVEARHGRIDVLVSNAGILPEATAQTPELLDVDLFRKTFITNPFGAVSVTQQFLLLLSTSPRACVSSITTARLLGRRRRRREDRPPLRLPRAVRPPPRALRALPALEEHEPVAVRIHDHEFLVRA